MSKRRPERLSDEQVAEIEAGLAHGGWCHALAREVQDRRADDANVASIIIEWTAMRALLNGGPCPTCGGKGWWLSADGETDCGTCERTGRTRGLAERLEAIPRYGDMADSLRELNRCIADIAALRQHGEQT